MKDMHSTTILAKGKQIGDCPILVAECLAIRGAIIINDNSEESAEDYY